MQMKSIDLEVLRDPSWWHWAATVPLLAAGISGITYAIEAAIVLSVAMCAYYFARIRAVKSFPVQIRLAYAAWLLCGFFPGLFWMHWIAFLGTTAMVTVGYCPLARMLQLLSFNRDERLTGALMWRLFIQDPCAGGLFRWAGACGSATAGPCSMAAGSDCSPVAQSTIEKGARHVRSV